MVFELGLRRHLHQAVRFDLMNSEFLEVIIREVHHWPSCPCRSCEAERARQQFPSKHILSLSVPAASLLGFVPPARPSGSLARDLMLKSKMDS